MQEKKGYSLYSNFKYIFQELKRFSMSSVLISFMEVPAKVIVTLITVYTPKIVLDAIQKPATIKEFIVFTFYK